MTGYFQREAEEQEDTLTELERAHADFAELQNLIVSDREEVAALRAKAQAQALQIITLCGDVEGLAADARHLRSTLDGLRGPLQEYVYRTQAHAPFEHAEWVNQIGAALMQAVNKVE